jgi:hypothetical protein
MTHIDRIAIETWEHYVSAFAGAHGARDTQHLTYHQKFHNQDDGKLVPQKLTPLLTLWEHIHTHYARAD